MSEQETQLYDKVFGEGHFLHRALLIAGVAALLIVVLWVLSNAINVFLLIFAGILVATLFRGMAELLSDHTPLSDRWALAVVLVLVIALLVVGGMYLGPRIEEQSERLADRLPQALMDVRDRLQEYEIARYLFAQTPDAGQLASRDTSIFTRITGIVSSALDLMLSMVVVIFVGLYLAYEPKVYERGILRLFPATVRHRVHDVLSAEASMLKWWLLGRLTSMFIVAVLSLIGLLVLGVELAWTLALIAGLLEWIPNFGPLLAVVPAVMVAMTQSPQLALYVVILYTVIQFVEGYLLTPIVQRYAVSLPPVVLISAQILMGALFGFIGFLLATPLVAVVIVLVQTLYVEEVLDEPVDILGEHNNGAT